MKKIRLLILTPKRGAKGGGVNFATNDGILLRFPKHLNPCILQTFLVMLDNAHTNVHAQLHALSRAHNSARTQARVHKINVKPEKE